MLIKINSLCNNDSCKNTVIELENQIKDIDLLNDLIKEECHVRELTRRKLIRRRRSYNAPLNVIGNIAHALFGVLDSNYADQLEGVLKNVQSNEDRVLTLIRNHTTIIDNTVNIVKKNYQEIEEALKKTLF